MLCRTAQDNSQAIQWKQKDTQERCCQGKEAGESETSRRPREARPREKNHKLGHVEAQLND